MWYKKLMKPPRILCILMLGVFFCAPTGARGDEDRKIDILVSFYPAYITARNVVKGIPGVTVTNLTPALTGCLHDYTLNTDDMRKISGAQVFVANGAGMEPFLERIAREQPHLTMIRLSEGLPLIKSASGGEDNPHAWVSISNVIVQVENLSRALGEFDPQRKELYSRNAAGYIARLEALRARMSAELAPYKGRPMITFHEAFPYFAREFGFQIAGVVEREPGSEPSARELAETIEIIRKNRIPALFSEPQYPAGAARVIARETGARVYVLDPAVTGPDEDDAYIRIMENNLAVLKEAFGKEG